MLFKRPFTRLLRFWRLFLIFVFQRFYKNYSCLRKFQLPTGKMDCQCLFSCSPCAFCIYCEVMQCLRWIGFAFGALINNIHLERNLNFIMFARHCSSTLRQIPPLWSMGEALSSSGREQSNNEFTRKYNSKKLFVNFSFQQKLIIFVSNQFVFFFSFLT